MSEKRYYWLKLMDDFFTSKRIKRLRSMAGGDTYTIIYLKMQLKALKTDGYLYYDGVMETFAEELALDIDEKPDDVKVTISYLLSVGLLETDGGNEYCLTYMQNLVGSENASAQRVRDFRNRKKVETLQCNKDVTQVKRVGNAEKEIEIDIEIDKEKDIKRKPENQIPPTLEMVAAYCEEQKNGINPQRFIDFYESKGWMVGKNKMKNWQAAIGTWEQRDKAEKEKKPEIKKSQYDFAALQKMAEDG